jgi:uncharacterized membrane protein
MTTLLLSAVLGLIVYGVYDLTNYSVFSKWSFKVAIIDIVWGTFLCGAVGTLTKLTLNYLK